MHVSPLLASRSAVFSRPQPSTLAFDALLLNSFDSAVAAAGDTDSSWLCRRAAAARIYAGLHLRL